MAYTYYPGCSLHATGIAYDKSLRAVFAKLGLGLSELDDWNCCGATAYMSVKETVAFAISARNLALAERAGRDVVAPCSACFALLNKTRKFLGELPQLRENVAAALAEDELECRFTRPVRHPLEVLIHDVGIERLRAAQTHSIAAFRPACYYGCQIVRPERALPEEPEVPMALEGLFAALGASPVEDFPPKVRCCGGMLVATAEDVAQRLVADIAGWARRRGGNSIVTVCPLCQGNLDILGRRADVSNGGEPLPILYFTQLLGLALGCTPREVGIEHGLVPLGIEAPPLAEATA
jgi:heterodisulfide reductase subunit B